MIASLHVGYDMRVYSFVRQGYQLQPIEVEVSLLPGIPQMHIVGQPDAVIRESVLRIRSALKSQGYRWPLHQKIIVNLRPNHLKKTSRGLDLAIIVAYLFRSGQLDGWESKEVYAYGDVGLSGDIEVPDDLVSLCNHPAGVPILTGIPTGRMPLTIWAAADLNQIKKPIACLPGEASAMLPRPNVSEISFAPKMARQLEILALGGHSTLLAGPAGSGKTTLANTAYELLPDVSEQEHLQLKYAASLFRQNLDWRPLVQPHHTISSIAMIGGGANLFPGELTRANGGLLILDELLEFSSTVKEALREPLERGYVTVTRNGSAVEFPARFRLLATTNLCPCGDKTPKGNHSCSFNLQRCRSVIQRLSGPLLDRFQILIYTDKKYDHGQAKRSTGEILGAIIGAREFQRRHRPWQDCDNARLSLAQLNGLIEPPTRDVLIPASVTSQRRRRALMAVARTLADMDGADLVGGKHIQESLHLTHFPFLEWQQL